MAVCPAAINKRNETATLFKEVTQGGMRNFYVFACCVAVIFALLYLGIHFGLASSEGDPDPALDPYLEADAPEVVQEISVGSDGWVHGFVEFPHDLDKVNLIYMTLQETPGGKIPGIEGGYSTTEVKVFVKVRGVDVARSLHQSRHRKRPKVYQLRERQRWANSLRDLWSLISITRTFRVHNMEIFGTELDGDVYEDGIIEADLELLLGGNWHNLAILMMQEEHTRPIQEDTLWDAGSKAYSLENPNIPK